MKKQFSPNYYLGIDIGSDSTGVAATDMDYKLLRVNSKDMWVSHVFESGKNAKERRLHRSTRRRMDRRSWRMALLRELFAEEINDKDSVFFERLQESRFLPKDKRVTGKNSLFSDGLFDDKAYHKKYPTIFHLRKALMEEGGAFDVRLVYLALHHMIKHRGHFLFEGQSFQSVASFQPVFIHLLEILKDYDIFFDCSNYDEIEAIVKDRTLNMTDKGKFLIAAMGAQKGKGKEAAEEKSQREAKAAVCEILAGKKVKLDKLFSSDAFEKETICLRDDFDTQKERLEPLLGDDLYLIEKIKAVYDWSILEFILNGNETLAQAKVAMYEEHREDLAVLKKMFLSYATEEAYDEVFSNKNLENNYVAYIGQSKAKNNKSSCSGEEFCAYLKKIFKDIVPTEAEFRTLLEKIELGKALPRQVSKDNGVIPHQLHLVELAAILEKAAAYLPFLNTVEGGFSVSEKIIKIFTFRIPYYIGPLNTHDSRYAWMVRKAEGKITPWNFDEKVDKLTSAGRFIHRMTNACTYLPEEVVLAKESVLYSKYMILNQLNTVKINGELMEIEIKQRLFEDLFLKAKQARKVTIKGIQAYLISKNYFSKANPPEITGLDEEIQGTMKAYIDFKRIFGDDMPQEAVIDEIVGEITVLGEAKELLAEYLVDRYGDRFTLKQGREICKLGYKDWGNLSRAFLTELYHIVPETGECQSVMSLLWDTNKNLQQLLSREYTFGQRLEERKAGLEVEGLRHGLLEKYRLSPTVKRSVWRTLAVVKEMVKVTGHPPKKIFVEMARDINGANEKKKTVSRKQQLLSLYKAIQKEEPALYEALSATDEGALRDNRCYLYYLQMGKCMYSGEPINFAEFSALYDRDHIYPQSKVKDDSLSNLVLVKRSINDDKKDRYPIPAECISPKARELWRLLLEKDMISKEKYHRLTRREGFSDAELAGFIARQLVETRQASKAVADLLKELFPISQIVYVKAGNVSAFRQQFDIVKCRMVNDLHHAKDAYLNIVVGSVYDTKFTSNPLSFLKEKPKYSMNRVFDFDVSRKGYTAWRVGKTINQVQKVVNRNNVQFTRYAYETSGEFFNANPLKKGGGQYPLKTKDSRLTIDNYGGYNSVSSAYYMLVEHMDKKKKVRSIEAVPIYLANKLKGNPDLLKEYIENVLGLKEYHILLPKIKVNALLRMGDFYGHLSGRTGNQLSLKPANPLILSRPLYAYAKKIEGYIERNKKDKTEYPITVHQKITQIENIALYDALLEKLGKSPYAMMRKRQREIMIEGRENFQTLSTAQQCQLLYNVFILFQNAARTADLSLTGVAQTSTTGSVKISKNLANIPQISIVYPSVTGLFEKEVDLKTYELENSGNY